MQARSYIPEKELKDHPQPIGYEQMDIIKEKMEKSICKIKCPKGGFGTGFFCKIPFPNEFNLFPVLITNYHVLDEADIKIGNNFIFSLKNDQITFQIFFDNKRRTYTNKENDITIVELKQKDGLYGYLLLDVDENVFKDNPQNYYPNKDIYIIHYPHGQKVGFSSGIIKNIYEDNYTISHLCVTKDGSSGGPIINILNHKVIGLHKGNKKGKNFNLGTLLKIPIQEFNQKYNTNNMNNKFLMNNNNFIKNSNNQNINNSNKNMNFNSFGANMNFNNNFNYQNMNFNQIPNMNVNNNQNMNNIFNMNFNNNQNMNFNNMPFMNFNNNQNMNFNPNQLSQNMLQMNNQFNMVFPYDNFMKESLPSEKKNFLIESKDLYPYIKGERKEIIFVNTTNESKIVKIPLSLRKNDIYAIAEKYKSSRYYEIIQLNHNNKTLDNDDSSIDFILNVDSIKIIEFLDCNTSYIDSLLLKHKNSPIIHNIQIQKDTGFKLILHLPNDITFFEMKKAFYAKMKIPFKYINEFKFLYKVQDIEDNAIIKNVFLINIQLYLFMKEDLIYVFDQLL